MPFVTIVICTYNRGSVLSACLESVARQTYPKDRYEVIVLDDHSTDDTASIASAHGNVRVIVHPANRGPAAARNTAIAAARGDIIACIDDDAVADPDWLMDLVAPFDAPEITATGGRVLAYKTDSIAERYLSAIGSGNPAPITFGQSNDPLRRFWAYIKSMFSPIEATARPVEVQAVFTLNCAYRTSAIKAIGGFDATLRYDEDTDVATRLRRAGARIMFIPAAVVHHRHRESLRRLIRQTYRNAVNTLHYYAKEKKVLPIFPLPILYVVIAILLVVIQPVIGILFIIAGPLLLYPWWPVRAFREDHLEYALYGHIQLAIESASILGLVRAKCSEIARGIRDRFTEMTAVSKRDLEYMGRFFSDKPIVLYSGWVGYGNLGDELLFFAHEKLFPDHYLIPYHSMSFLNLLIPFNKKKIKAGFLGGGTLINLPGTWLKDTKSMLAMDIPVFALGTGVNFILDADGKTPIAGGALGDWIEPLSRLSYFGVRGPLSAEILNTLLPKKAEIVGDTAISLAPVAYASPAKDTAIGICVVHDKEISPLIDEELYRDIFLTFIRNSIAGGFEIVLLPAKREDEPFNKKLQQEINDPRCTMSAFRDDYPAYFSEVAKCTLFIGQKLHSTVTATMLRVPSIMLSYHSKCVDYMSSIGMEDQIIPVRALSIKTLEEKARRTLEHRSEIRARLDAVIHQYSGIQNEKARQIKKSLTQ